MFSRESKVHLVNIHKSYRPTQHWEIFLSAVSRFIFLCEECYSTVTQWSFAKQQEKFEEQDCGTNHLKAFLFLMPDALICKLGGVIYKILKFTLKNVNKDSFLPYLCSITYRKYNSLILFLTRIFCTKVCHYTLQNIVKTMFTLYGGHILL